MISRRLSQALGCLLGAFLPALAAVPAPTTDAIDKLPPAANRTVDFVRDIQPILETSCVKCHGRGKAKGDWQLETRELFLKTGESNPSTIVGNSAQSRIIHLVAGTDPDEVMPQKGKRLTPEEVGLLRAWIDQGLKWDSSITFAKPAARNLKPHLPELPDSGPSHPLDRLLKAYFQEHQVRPASVIPDPLFARRAYLDTIGLLPTPEELERFLKDKNPNKRAELIRNLLADNTRYAQHWLTFWNDLLRNDYKGTGYIDGGRKPISLWLYSALQSNKPYDQFVRELVNPTEASEGFTKGIVWRGEVNASMTPPMQAAQNIGQALMGVNLKCASCHDSFIDDWQLSDAYGLAGIYAEEKLQMVQCDRPTGKYAPLKFLFPELGAVDPKAPRKIRLEQLAKIITQPENGRLSRTVVNRLWARFMGRGLVEPMDVMQNAAWNSDILDWLAEDLASHGWNLKRTMEWILTSQAYQLPSVNLPEKAEEHFVFQGPGIRRLSAEQFRDALGSITGVWFEKPEGGLEAVLKEKGPQDPLSATPFWIWSDPHGATGVPPGTHGFKKTFTLSAPPTEALLFVQVDNSARVWVNGTPAQGTESPDWSRPSVYNLQKQVHPGTNVLFIEAVNGGAGSNPAGLLVYARIRLKTGTKEKVNDFASDGSWKTFPGPLDPRLESQSKVTWNSAQVLGPTSLAPWNVGNQLAEAVSGRAIPGRIRASLTSADPLALALGRPNREQITTLRQTTATTLQALELTNGDTLSSLLKKGAQRLISEGTPGSTLVKRVFIQALSRPPSSKEMVMAMELVGQKPRTEGVEDLLWSIAMLPEFQLTF